jgi:hypothetical protein
MHKIGSAMQLASAGLLLALLTLGCAQTSAPPASSSVASGPPLVATGPAPPAASSVPAAVSTVSSGPEAFGPVQADAGEAGSPTARYRACRADTDCVDVPSVGCCHNGRKEAVAISQVDAYRASFTCPRPHPICPSYVMLDRRVPQCDDETKLCTMVQPERIVCGGATSHKCPDGYRCLQPSPGVSGTCGK